MSLIGSKQQAQSPEPTNKSGESTERLPEKVGRETEAEIREREPRAELARRANAEAVKLEVLQNFPERYDGKWVTLKNVGLGDLRRDDEGGFYLGFNSEYPAEGAVVLPLKLPGSGVSATVQADLAEKLLKEGVKLGVFHKVNLTAKVKLEGKRAILHVDQVDFVMRDGSIKPVK